MENNTTSPVLSTDTESLAVISAILPSFYSYIKEDSNVIKFLLPLQKSGNKKAGEIINYLLGEVPAYIHYKSLYEYGNYNGDHNTAYNLSWTDFQIEYLGKVGTFVSFDFEALLEKEIKQCMIQRYVINCRHPHTFRKEFLLKEVSAWVETKGYKLRRSDPVKNKGLLDPYVKISHQFFDSRPSEDYPQNEWCNLTKHVRGKCSIQLLPL